MPESLEPCFDQDAFERALEASFDVLPDSRIRKSMHYSLMAGGKRIRPHLMAAVLQGYGQDQLDQDALRMACAIEMMHTYSLIHDDMPEMDNDTLRRGKPCNHIVYGNDVALLAGDALQSFAFEQAALLEDRVHAADLCLLLAHKAGPYGMAYGQDLDLNSSSSSSLEELEAIEQYKTGCLFELALMSGAILADHPEDLEAWQTIGRELGILFQIQDDLFERSASEEQMGKSLSDADGDKATALSLYGEEQARKRMKESIDRMDEALETIHGNTGPVRALLEAVKSRTH